jgi:hypothetical protein
MNVRSEFRQAFRQYRRRLGLPLACSTSEIRAGELCFFNVDGTVVSLGNVLDGPTEDRCMTTTSVDPDIDPIISNGMRCRTLTDAERERYFVIVVVLNIVTSFRITRSMRRICCHARSSLSLTTHFFARH